MWQLPALDAGATMVRLPATDWAARRIQAALLLEANHERIALWRKLLSEEPAFLIWVLARAAVWRDEPPGSLEDIAEWLAGHALDLWIAAPAVESLDCDLIAPCRLAWGRQAWRAAQLPNRAHGASWFEELSERVRAVRGWLVAAAPSDASQGAPTGEIRGPADDELLALPRWWPRSAESDWSRVDGASGPSSVEGERREASALEVSFLGRWLSDSDTDAVRDLNAVLRQWKRWRLDAEENERQLRQAKLAALKEFAYGASHEINNPLANIATRAQTLLADERDVERRRKLAMIAAQAFRAHEMISDLMLFARPPALNRQPCDWRALVEGVVAAARDEHRDRELRVVAPADGEFVVDVDATQCAVALQALVRNACEWTPAGGVVEVRWEATRRADLKSRGPADERGAGGELTVQVDDSGSGLSAAAREHLFDPFYSGREAGRGLGFGLSKCWRIVTEHGGSIEAGDSPLGGARFQVRLPIHWPAAAEESS